MLLDFLRFAGGFLFFRISYVPLGGLARNNAKFKKAFVHYTLKVTDTMAICGSKNR